MIVYKVVRKDGNGTLLSVSVDHPGVRVPYRLGKKSVAKVKGTPLMAFKRKRDAEWFVFIATFDDAIILRCRAQMSRRKYDGICVNPRQPLLPSIVKTFWGQRNPVENCKNAMWAPTGTVLCMSITPLEEV